MLVKSIKIHGPLGTAALIAAALAVAVGAYAAAEWGFGNALSVRADDVELANLAVRMAPDDPQTHYAAAVLYGKTFVPDDVPVSLKEYETAAALSPNNYLLWLELGSARERSGDTVGGEKALRKALELAPNYSNVQWALGNALLRAGKTDEAFTFVQKAALGNPAYLAPATGIAMQIFENDASAVRTALGNSPAIESALASSLAAQERFDEAFETWNMMPAEAKKGEFKEKSETLYGQFMAAKKFRSAMAVRAALQEGEGEVPAVGKIVNGGFEGGLKPSGAKAFEWQLGEGDRPQIALAGDQKHGGNQSLLIIFNTTEAREFRPVSQLVVVEPGASYEFETFYKGGLKSTGQVKWEITDAGDGTVLAATPPAAAAQAWTPLRSAFAVPAGSEAVSIRLTLAGCTSPICPITGRLWIDDVVLRKK